MSYHQGLLYFVHHFRDRGGIVMASQSLDGDLITAVLKGLLYGVIILGISAQTALTVVERGRSTGSATTFAVVVGLTAVLISDAVISILTLD